MYIRNTLSMHLGTFLIKKKTRLIPKYPIYHTHTHLNCIVGLIDFITSENVCLFCV